MPRETGQDLYKGGAQGVGTNAASAQNLRWSKDTAPTFDGTASD